MLDFVNKHIRMQSIGRENKALLSTLSDRLMPGDERGYGYDPISLSSNTSLGLKAKNLLAWGEATSKAHVTKYGLPVGHMSISSIRRA